MAAHARICAGWPIFNEGPSLPRSDLCKASMIPLECATTILVNKCEPLRWCSEVVECRFKARPTSEV